MQSHETLLNFLDTVQSAAGASDADLVLHTEPVERGSLLVVGRNPGAAAPEMADEDATWALVSNAVPVAPDSRCVQVLPSADPECAIIRVSVSRLVARPRSERRSAGERRSAPDVRTAPAGDGALWIGLRKARHVERLVAPPGDGSGDSETRPDPLFDACCRSIWSVYYLSSLLQDPVTRLPGRLEMRRFLKRAAAVAGRDGQPIGLLLVNPDDFSMINHRFGRQSGDLAVRQVAEELGRSLRATDGVFHYGGAVFAAVLPATSADQCRAVAEKIRSRLTAFGYLDDSVKLTFSMGVALAEPGDLATLETVESELMHYADAALNAAKLSGGARIVATGLNPDTADAGALASPLHGIFAADTEKDYRNMLLLWETVALISTQTDPVSIAEAFIERLAVGFRPDRVALFKVADDTVESLAANVRDESHADGRASVDKFELDDVGRQLVIEALETSRVARSRAADARCRGFSAYAVPLVAGDVPTACVYLDADGRRLQLDSSDVVFLNALATQMAVAMDRAELAARWLNEQENERRQLREEVRGLRQALHHSKMVYHSEAMHSVMETLRQVAPSDATVLIVGESGTGKEMLANSLHEFSDRRDASFVVFDCGAVAHNLLEAELFGHTKGAFTGADSASEGRIAQAEGGTLFLDEIGELPLAVQSKLLRFVQEKEYSPVGSSKTRRVDVRLVAATNRRLQDEVGAGRFRSDLYYRLRVISVQAIPLRERSEDILPLARFFIEKFAAQYGKVTHRMSSAAQLKLLHHGWPGNVRELQNCILRAVLTQGGDELDADAIELFPESTDIGAVSAIPPPTQAAGRESIAPCKTPGDTVADPWTDLHVELEHQVTAAVTRNSRRPAPIGRWLNEDLVLAAHEHCEKVARRAANLVGVAESTFRRQLDKATAVDGSAYRPESWAPVRRLVQMVIEDLLRAGGAESSLLERARRDLLNCVHVKTSTRPGAGASLMGVSPPTYRRWLDARESKS